MFAKLVSKCWNQCKKVGVINSILKKRFNSARPSIVKNPTRNSNVIIRPRGSSNHNNNIISHKSNLRIHTNAHMNNSNYHLSELESFFNIHKTNDMYPFSSHYPWIVSTSDLPASNGSTRSKITGACYLNMMDSDTKGDDCEWLLKCEPIILLKEQILKNAKHKSGHNEYGQPFATHCIFEEYNAFNDVSWYYCKPRLQYPKISNINLALSDNIEDNPVWNHFMENNFDEMTLSYLGGGVTCPDATKNVLKYGGVRLMSKMCTARINTKRNVNDSMKQVKQQMFVMSVSGTTHVDPSNVLLLTEGMREKMLVTDKVCQMVTSSIYYIPIYSTLGNSTVIVACMNGFDYKDFMPVKNSMLTYSSGNSGNAPIRGLWHGLVYEPPIAIQDNANTNQHLLNSVSSNDNDKNSENNNNSEIQYADSVMISMHPTKMTEKLSNALGVSGNPLFVETMGDMDTVCRSLILASKLEVKNIVLFGQPLAVAQALWYWRHKMEYEQFNKDTKVSVVVGGYLAPKNLLAFMKETMGSDNIEMECYYGTTDFETGCMKCDTNEVNGYKIVNGKMGTSKSGSKLGGKNYKGQLYLSDSHTTICTNDKIVVKNDVQNNNEAIYYFQYKNDFEEWIVEHWTSYNFSYLTGNMALGDDNRVLYLQCREKRVTQFKKSYIRQTIENGAFFQKLLSKHGIVDVKLLEYNNFESMFASNLIQQKPLYRKLNQQ